MCSCSIYCLRSFNELACTVFMQARLPVRLWMCASTVPYSTTSMCFQVPHQDLPL